MIGRACRLSASRSSGTVSRCNSTKAFASLCKPSDKQTDATSTSFPKLRRCSTNPDSIRTIGPRPIRLPNRPESYGNCIRDIEPIAHAAQTRYYANHFPPDRALLRVGAVQDVYRVGRVRYSLSCGPDGGKWHDVISPRITIRLHSAFWRN